MSRREENRRGVRKRRRERVDPDADDVVSRSRYESRPSRRQEDRRDRDIYDYSAYDTAAGYSGWQDLYRPDYRGDPYGRSYGSFNRGHDYDFYDNYRSSYYDDDAGGSSCRACNGNGGWGRREKMGYDPYIYRYEEQPRHRHRRSPESSRRPRRPPEDAREGPREAEKIGNRNDVNVYAMHNVTGQDGFKGKSNKKPEPVRGEVLSEDERDSRGRERERRRKSRRTRLEYDDDDDGEVCEYDNRKGRGRCR